MDSKKNIVFVIPSLDAGGAEKSLVNLLNTIDFDLYIVDLVVLHKKGLFLPMLPKDINVISLNKEYTTFSKSLLISCLTFFKELKFKLVLSRILFFLKNNFSKNKAQAEQNSWNDIQKSISKLEKKYDAAIGFLEKTSIYFIIDKIDAKNKIGWIHTTYSKSGMSSKFDSNYFSKLSAVIGVSEECSIDLVSNFPQFKSKIKTIYNIVSPKLIFDLANEPTDGAILKQQNLLVTIARLSHEKGCDLAIETSKLLKQKGIVFKWVVIGEGPERASLEAKVKEYQLENEVLFIGLKENPYPYIKASKIYIQPSRYEGKSMAIEEAKIINKPIVITNYPTAKDQINHMVNGIITTMEPIAISNSIENLILDINLQQKLTLNLSKESFGTEVEILKLYQLINE